jgi:hypothetical protein
MKITKEELKRLIMEEMPSGRRGPGIHVTVAFDIIPGFNEKIDLNSFRSKIRNMIPGLTARLISDSHVTEAPPTNVSIEITRAQNT